jgi:hypothetical protein
MGHKVATLLGFDESFSLRFMARISNGEPYQTLYGQGLDLLGNRMFGEFAILRFQQTSPNSTPPPARPWLIFKGFIPNG